MLSLTRGINFSFSELYKRVATGVAPGVAIHLLGWYLPPCATLADPQLPGTFPLQYRYSYWEESQFLNLSEKVNFHCSQNDKKTFLVTSTFQYCFLG